MMKNEHSGIGSSHLWEAVFSLQEREEVDISGFSSEEQQEIKEYLEIINAIKYSQKNIPEPSKTSFSEMLINLPEEPFQSQKTDWNHFFNWFRRRALKWATIPVFGALAVVASLLWYQQPVVQVAKAEALSEEIQQDFKGIHRDIEEIELLRKELNLVSFEEEQSSFYFKEI